jgi:hypothetical protein
MGKRTGTPPVYQTAAANPSHSFNRNKMKCVMNSFESLWEVVTLWKAVDVNVQLRLFYIAELPELK